MTCSGMNAKLARNRSSFMISKKPVYAHVSNEDELKSLTSLRPKTKYSRLNISFNCSRCGEFAIKNLMTLQFPFICSKCALSIAHTTDEYKENYAKVMTAKCGENYWDAIHSLAMDAINDKYGGCAGMYAHSAEKRINTMLERYGVTCPAQIAGHGAKSAATKLQRYGDANYNNRDKANETIVEKYGSMYTFQQDKVRRSGETKQQRYGSATYNNREKAEMTSLSKYGVRVPSQLKEIADKAHYKYTYNGIIFDSSYDLSYYIWLTDNNIHFEYRPDIQLQYEYDGKTHYYNPDFKIGERLVELKGRQFFKDKDPNGPMVNPYNHDQDGLYEAKHQCMLANNVEIIVDCSEYEKYVAEHYGNNYIAGCRNRQPKRSCANKLNGDNYELLQD